MISVTRQTAALSTILLLTTIVLCTARLYINPFAIEVAESEFMPRVWETMLAAAMLFASAIIINRTTVKVGLFGGFSALPVSVFGFLAFGVLLSPNIVSAAATTFCMALGVLFLLRSMQTVGEKEALFTGALMLGVMPIIYPPAIAFALIMPIIMFIAPLNVRQAIIIVAGYLLPMLGASYVYWYLGGGIADLTLGIWQNITTPSQITLLEGLPIVTIAICVVLVPMLLYGFMLGIHTNYSMLVPVRKTIQTAIWLMIIGVAALLFVPGCGLAIIPTIAIPATILITFALDRMEAMWANWFYITLVALVIIHLVIY